METSEILSYSSIAIAVGSVIFGVINHKRIRSNCCGHRGEISLDVENTSPTPGQLKVSKPPVLTETTEVFVSP